MSPDEIRDATGNASRTLGPEGARKGLTTTLPLALDARSFGLDSSKSRTPRIEAIRKAQKHQ